MTKQTSLEQKIRKPYHEYKDSKDPLERMVYFIASLSPHNYWKGYEALHDLIRQVNQEAMPDKINHFPVDYSAYQDGYNQALDDYADRLAEAWGGEMTNTFEKEIIEEFTETCLLYMADAKVDKAQSLRQCGKLSIALQDALHQQRIKDAEEFRGMIGKDDDCGSPEPIDTEDARNALRHELRKRLEEWK